MSCREKLGRRIMRGKTLFSGAVCHMYTYTSMFISVLLPSPSLHLSSFSCSLIHSLFPSRLLQQALTYTTSLTQSRSRSKDEGSNRFWEAMIKKTCDIIDGVVSLLPLDSFLVILHQLLSQSEGEVQRKAMNMLNSKLEDQKIKFTDHQVNRYSAISLIKINTCFP